MSDDGFRPLDPRYSAGGGGYDDGGDGTADPFGADDRDPGHHSLLTARRQELREHRHDVGGFVRLAVGIYLVSLGAEILLGWILPFHVELTSFTVGFLLLAWWARTKARWAYIAGVLVVGSALGSLLSGVVGGSFGGALRLAGLALAFSVLAGRPPHHRWARIPALVLWILAGVRLVIGLTSALVTGIGASGLFGPQLFAFGADTAPLVAPAALCAGGVVLLARNRLPRPLANVALVGAVVVFAVALTATAGDQFSLGAATTAGDARAAGAWQALPALEGRMLEIRTRSGAVLVESTDNATPKVRVRDGRGGISERNITAAPASVIIDGLDSQNVQVLLPVGSQVRITTRSGLVGVDLDDNPELNLETQSGDVFIDGEPSSPGVYPGTSSGKVHVKTESGNIGIMRAQPG